MAFLGEAVEDALELAGAAVEVEGGFFDAFEDAVRATVAHEGEDAVSQRAGAGVQLGDEGHFLGQAGADELQKGVVGEEGVAVVIDGEGEAAQRCAGFGVDVAAVAFEKFHVTENIILAAAGQRIAGAVAADDVDGEAALHDDLKPCYWQKWCSDQFAFVVLNEKQRHVKILQHLAIAALMQSVGDGFLIVDFFHDTLQTRQMSGYFLSLYGIIALLTREEIKYAICI